MVQSQSIQTYAICTFEYNDNNEGAGAIDMNANIVALLHISGCEFRQK